MTQSIALTRKERRKLLRDKKKFTKFTLFRKLPTEVRAMMWQLALPPGAERELRFVRLYPRDLRDDVRHAFKTFGSPPPALLQTCSESRMVTRKHYVEALNRPPILNTLEHHDPYIAGDERLTTLAEHHNARIHLNGDEQPGRGLLQVFPKQNYINFEIDTVVLKRATFFDLSNKDNLPLDSARFDQLQPHTIKTILSFLQVTDTERIIHLSIENQVFTQKDYIYDRSSWSRPVPVRFLNRLELHLSILRSNGHFKRLKTLELVVIIPAYVQETKLIDS
jgi:hypothetical protein